MRCLLHQKTKRHVSLFFLSFKILKSRLEPFLHSICSFVFRIQAKVPEITNYFQLTTSGSSMWIYARKMVESSRQVTFLFLIYPSVMVEMIIIPHNFYLSIAMVLRQPIVAWAWWDNIWTAINRNRLYVAIFFFVFSSNFVNFSKHCQWVLTRYYSLKVHFGLLTGRDEHFRIKIGHFSIEIIFFETWRQVIINLVCVFQISIHTWKD